MQKELGERDDSKKRFDVVFHDDGLENQLPANGARTGALFGQFLSDDRSKRDKRFDRSTQFNDLHAHYDTANKACITTLALPLAKSSLQPTRPAPIFVHTWSTLCYLDRCPQQAHQEALRWRRQTPQTRHTSNWV
jgi:hypothetical protein